MTSVIQCDRFTRSRLAAPTRSMLRDAPTREIRLSPLADGEVDRRDARLLARVERGDDVTPRNGPGGVDHDGTRGRARLGTLSGGFLQQALELRLVAGALRSHLPRGRVLVGIPEQRDPDLVR